MRLSRYSEAELPTIHGSFRLLVYREAPLGQGTSTQAREHMAIVRGEINGVANVLVRLHSECWTAEVMGSMKCDCREQLHAAMDRIQEEGRGVVVYLRQEGRGIGLGNKIRAYALQNRGADTVEANLALGFVADARDYRVAAAILRDLGVQSLRLMTNNPLKVRALRAANLAVLRVPLWVGENPYNRGYLAVKRAKMGHLARRPLLSSRKKASPPR